MKALLSLAVLTTLVLPTLGCSTLYTERTYGPQQTNNVRLQDGSTIPHTLATLGAPDVQKDFSDGTSILIYRSLAYQNVLGVYATEEKMDYVLTFRGGRLADQTWSHTGETMSIFAGQVLTLGVPTE